MLRKSVLIVVNTWNLKPFVLHFDLEMLPCCIKEAVLFFSSLESQLRHDRCFINLCIKDCKFSLFAFLIILDTLFVATIRAFVMSWVAMFIFVFLPPAEPYSGLSGKVCIWCTAPFPSAERVVPTRITQLVYWPLVTLHSLEFTLFLILQWFSCRPGYGSQGAENSGKSSSSPPCASVVWSTFLAVLPFISVRPSRRQEAQAEGLITPRWRVQR